MEPAGAISYLPLSKRRINTTVSTKMMVPRLASSSRAVVCRNWGQPQSRGEKIDAAADQRGGDRADDGRQDDEAKLAQQPDRAEFAAYRLQSVSDGAGKLLDIVHATLSGRDPGGISHQCGGFEVSPSIAVSSSRNFKSKTTLET